MNALTGSGPARTRTFLAVSVVAMLVLTGLVALLVARITDGITRTDAPRDDVSVRGIFYANRTVRQFMDIQAMRDANVLLTLNDYAGKPITTWRGVPIKIVDQLLNTETLVS